MTVLTGVSDEFMDWLDNCPVQWHLIKQTDEDLTYCFEKEINCEHDFIPDNNDGKHECRFCGVEE